MQIWERIKKWLFSSSKSPSKRYHPDLHQLDVDAIAKELALKDEAKKLGEAGIPSPEDTVITAPEARVVQYIEKARLDYIDWASIRLSVLNEDIESRDVTKVVNQALQADKEFERKADSIIAERAALILTLAKKASDYQTELGDFRNHHSLTRSPNLHSGAAKFLGFALLLLFVLVEGMLNAFFFAQGMSSGLVGGFLAAALFAALNVIVAFFWGRLAIPYIYHRDTTSKIFGFLGLVTAVFCMACISFSIAHYRDALTAEALDPAKTAWEVMRSSPLDLHDIMSWFLFYCSIAFAIGALLDGLYSDDRYPGYGKVAQKAASAKDEYEGELDDIRERLESLKEEDLLRFDADVKKVQILISQRTSLINDKTVAQSRLYTALGDASNCLDALLKIFRTENNLNRKGLAAPKYFNEVTELKDLQLPDSGIESDLAELRKQNATVASLLNRLESIRANIQASFNQQYDRLTPLNDHFHETRMSA